MLKRKTPYRAHGAPRKGFCRRNMAALGLGGLSFFFCQSCFKYQFDTKCHTNYISSILLHRRININCHMMHSNSRTYMLKPPVSYLDRSSIVKQYVFEWNSASHLDPNCLTFGQKLNQILREYVKSDKGGSFKSKYSRLSISRS